MNEIDNISARQAMDVVSNDLRESLEKSVGERVNPDIKKRIKEVLNTKLGEFVNRGIISSGDPNFKVNIMWDKFSLKQKFKWFAFNKLPILKQHSQKMRDIIDEARRIARELNPDSVYYQLRYPDYLEPSPKQTMVVDMKICATRGVDFIPINLKIGEDV